MTGARLAERAAQLGPRARAAALVAAAALALAVAVFGGELGGAALRALAFFAVLAGTALLARRRTAPRGTPAPVTVAARQPLSKESGVAFLRAGGRSLLVGYGTGGVTLIAELPTERNDR